MLSEAGAVRDGNDCRPPPDWPPKASRCSVRIDRYADGVVLVRDEVVVHVSPVQVGPADGPDVGERDDGPVDVAGIDRHSVRLAIGDYEVLIQVPAAQI